MTRDAQPDRAPNQGPAPVVPALVGLLVVLLLVTFPIHIGPGSDHGRESCGNALQMDLSPWQNGPDGPYRDIAHRACTEARVTRVAWAAVVVSATVLISLMLLRRPGQSTTDRSRPSPWRIGPSPSRDA